MVVARPSDRVATVEGNGSMNQIVGSSKLVDLIDKSPREKRKGQRLLIKGLAAGGQTRSTEEGNNRFPTANGEIVFNPVFEDDENGGCCKLTGVFAQRKFLTVM